MGRSREGEGGWKCEGGWRKEKRKEREGGNRGRREVEEEGRREKEREGEGEGSHKPFLEPSAHSSSLLQQHSLFVWVV